MTRFGAYRLDETSGELWREDVAVARLAPQPARLLAHLIRRQPQVVTHDEIRELLWSDVEVDVEQSLHACVRQIRAALDDSASTPRFVETIPRRGYRFVGPDAARQARKNRPLLIATLTVVALLALAWFRFGTAPSPSATRVAVMPFEPIESSGTLSPGNGIAEGIVRLLTAHDAATEVIGPTTTERYDGKPQRLRALIEEFDIDLIVNARELTDPAGRVLIELIRAEDGAHVWVRYLDELPQETDPAEAIADAVEDVTRQGR